MGSLTFYFDRNFGRRFPEALERVASPFKVEFHHSPRSRFPHNMPDDEWLSAVGAKGWIVFSHDRKFHEDNPAFSAIKQYTVGCFYLWGAEESSWEKLRCFVRGSDRIIEAINNTSRPFIYQVSKMGRLMKIEFA